MKSIPSKVLLLPVTILLLLFTSFVLTVDPANGMGQPPSACNNRYIGEFISFLITFQNGTTFDAFAHPNSTLNMPTLDSYNATFTLHTADMSVDNNTLLGGL